jgi:hypothetical protein
MKQDDTIDILSKICWEEGKSERIAPWKVKSSRNQKRRGRFAQKCRQRARAIDKQKLLKEVKEEVI